MPDDKTESEKDTHKKIKIPEFKIGGRVDKTGLALVHEGEKIIPAPDARAEIAEYGEPNTQRVNNFYFPVEIEIVGDISKEQIKEIENRIYKQLVDALSVE